MPEHQPEIGDIVGAGPDNPVLERHYPAPAPAVFHGPPSGEVAMPATVVANFSLAREPDGALCIRIEGTRTLTAADAHKLAMDLDVAAEQVGETRRNCGFES